MRHQPYVPLAEVVFYTRRNRWYAMPAAPRPLSQTVTGIRLDVDLADAVMARRA